MPTLTLIDGSSYLYRAFHAPVRTAEGGILRNAAGTPTNAVYIFITMLRKLINEHHPEYIARIVEDARDIPRRAVDIVGVAEDDAPFAFDGLLRQLVVELR